MQIETYAYPHILGGLLGQALGDAWTTPALYRPEQTWAQYDGWIETLLAPPADHPLWAGFKAGQVTDDIQQVVVLAQTIIANRGRVTLDAVVKAIVKWYDKIDGDHSPSVVAATRQAIEALKAKADPQLTGRQGDSNGSAVRVSPIGFIHPGDPEAAVEEALIFCRPTHFTDVAASATCAVAAALAHALTPNTTLESIVDNAIWGANEGLTHGQPWYGPSVGRKIDFAVQLATDTNYSELERVHNLYELVGSTPAAADSVPCAFGILALSDGDPVRTAIYAAALSGDAVAVGAIACAIAGAWRGIDAIALDYIDTLRQANPQYDFEEMAEGLYAVALSNHSAFPHVGTRLLEDILDESDE